MVKAIISIFFSLAMIMPSHSQNILRSKSEISIEYKTEFLGNFGTLLPVPSLIPKNMVYPISRTVALTEIEYILATGMITSQRDALTSTGSLRQGDLANLSTIYSQVSESNSRFGAFIELDSNGEIVAVSNRFNAIYNRVGRWARNPNIIFVDSNSKFEAAFWDQPSMKTMRTKIRNQIITAVREFKATACLTMIDWDEVEFKTEIGASAFVTANISASGKFTPSRVCQKSE